MNHFLDQSFENITKKHTGALEIKVPSRTTLGSRCRSRANMTTKNTTQGPPQKSRPLTGISRASGVTIGARNMVT
jgi:hypothetical protein